MSGPSGFDALVVGAGYAGLACAAMMPGRRVLVLERHDSVVTKRRGGFGFLRRFDRDDSRTQRGPVHDRRIAAPAHDAGAIRDEQAHRQREHHEQRQAIHGG